VYFYHDGTFIGRQTVPGSNHSITWNNVPAGIYRLIARAGEDHDGLAAASKPVTIMVTNAPPMGAITSSPNGAVVPAPGNSANVTIKANAAPSVDRVGVVDFHQDAALIGTDTNAPDSIP
jgi:hypothetical protein